MKRGRTVLQAKRLGIHSCSPDTSLVSAIRTIVDEEVSSLVVADDDGYLLGLISRVEILAAYLAMDDWASQPVSAHMTTKVVVVTPQTLLRDAAQLMLDHRTHQVVVVLEEDGRQRPVALVTDSDLAYHMVKGP